MPTAAPALFNLPAPRGPARPAKPMTVLSYGLGADSTAILLMFLEDPVRYGLEPDLSDLIVLHAVTGDEWPDSLSYVNRLVLPRLAERRVRVVQVARRGRHDADGVLVLEDSRTTSRIHQAGPWRLSDWLLTGGTVPQMASGRRTCSIKFKGWCLDHWALAEFGQATFRRVIGYHAAERSRMEKDTKIQDRLNQRAGRVICEPAYPLVDAGMDRAAVEAYVLQRLGEPIKKSYCTFCPFSGVCASRERHEERLRAHPDLAADALAMEYASMALNEPMSLYGTRSLYQQLTEDERNDGVLTAFEERLDAVPFSLYEVRRLYLPGRTKDCRRYHGARCARPRWWCRTERTTACRRDHASYETGADGEQVDLEPQCAGVTDGCRGSQVKGAAWRSVRTVWEGPRLEAKFTLLSWGREDGARLRRGERSQIKRLHYLDRGEGYPAAEAYLVAAPSGADDKNRESFERRWTEITGLIGTRWEPIRPLARYQRGRGSRVVPVVRPSGVAHVRALEVA
ncbi:hypothetical protein [Streptomyces sp. NBC_01601]|uniref:hypothetical protein n=1 Tax=Streptomyces sp. NBC_01601 TaxID=2975892 RepID=UPI002E2E705A|nr:hypothetical protein [Streptomyces sp. NBC_01601]